MFGAFGADRFYAGRTGFGFAKIASMFFGIGFLWCVIDAFLAIAGKQLDRNGNYIAPKFSFKKIGPIIIVYIIVFGAIAVFGVKSLYNSITSYTNNEPATITSNVNFRSGPSVNDEIIKTLNQDDAVILTGKIAGNWTQVSHDSDTGWVSSEFLKKEQRTVKDMFAHIFSSLFKF